MSDQETFQFATTYFYGCEDRPGHFLKAKGVRRLDSHDHYNALTKELGRHLDGGFAPKRTPSRQGASHIWQVNGWTVLAVDDYTVDTRGGSHATFVFRGEHDWDSTIELVRLHWSEILERVGPIFLAKLSPQRLGEIRRNKIR